MTQIVILEGIKHRLGSASIQKKLLIQHHMFHIFGELDISSGKTALMWCPILIILGSSKIKEMICWCYFMNKDISYTVSDIKMKFRMKESSDLGCSIYSM